MTNDQDLLARGDQRLQDVEDCLHILVALRVPFSWRAKVKVRVADVADVQRRQISGRKLWTVGIDPVRLEKCQQRFVRSWGVIRAVAKHNGEIGLLRRHVAVLRWCFEDTQRGADGK